MLKAIDKPDNTDDDISRLSTDYNKLSMTYLDSDDLCAIEVKSKALTLDECFDFLCVVPSDVPPAELAIATRVWRRGRASAIHTASDKLFSAMSMRGGGQVAFDYLKQLSSTFQIEVTPDSPTNPNSGFSFNVIMPEDKSTPST